MYKNNFFLYFILEEYIYNIKLTINIFDYDSIKKSIIKQTFSS